MDEDTREALSEIRQGQIRIEGKVGVIAERLSKTEQTVANGKEAKAKTFDVWKLIFTAALVALGFLTYFK